MSDDFQKGLARYKSDHVIKGVPMKGKVPPLAENFNGACIVTGSADCLWEDLEKAKVGLDKYDIMCVNHSAIAVSDKITHIASLEYRYMIGFYNLATVNTKGHIYTHSSTHGDGVGWLWNMCMGGGGSGLFATFLALVLGYDKVILAGMPMTNTPKFCQDPRVRFDRYGATSQTNAWTDARDLVFDGRVKSMSGQTKELLNG